MRISGTEGFKSFALIRFAKLIGIQRKSCVDQKAIPHHHSKGYWRFPTEKEKRQLIFSVVYYSNGD